mgnify:CR=1 FL=1
MAVPESNIRPLSISVTSSPHTWSTGRPVGSSAPHVDPATGKELWRSDPSTAAGHSGGMAPMTIEGKRYRLTSSSFTVQRSFSRSQKAARSLSPPFRRAP